MHELSEDWLEPVLVLAAGRSGSTLMMQLLGTSSEIVFDRVYPFENCYLCYFMRWSRLLASAEPPACDWQLAGSPPPPEANKMGPLPFFTAPEFHSGPTPLWYEAFHSTWREFCERARQQPICAPEPSVTPRFYAEKAPLFVAEGLVELGIRHRRLFFLRDPRDVFLSVRAFNQKRGTLSFGVREDDTEWTHALRFVADRRQILRNLASVEETADTTLIRYENLVGDLPAEAARTGALLGVELDAAKVEARQKSFGEHMSAMDARSSVAGWKTEMSAELRDLFSCELGAELTALGYPVS